MLDGRPAGIFQGSPNLFLVETRIYCHVELKVYQLIVIQLRDNLNQSFLPIYGQFIKLKESLQVRLPNFKRSKKLVSNERLAPFQNIHMVG
jgi:hypothetical protein